jgi:hypothetical protein
MNIARNPENLAADLSVAERTLLLCIASGVDWEDTPNVTSVTVAISVLKGLVERDTDGRLTLSGEGVPRSVRCSKAVRQAAIAKTSRAPCHFT